MALRCALVSLCVIYALVGGNTQVEQLHGDVVKFETGAENVESEPGVFKVLIGHQKRSGHSGILNNVDSHGKLVGEHAVENVSGVSTNVDQRSAKKLQHVSSNDNDRRFFDYRRFNRSEVSRTRLRKVEDSLDFVTKKSFENATSSGNEDFAVTDMGQAKSWMWSNVDQVYGLMKDLVNTSADIETEEERGISKKKKKKKLIHFLVKLILGLKVLMMGVFLPGVLAFTLLLAWKAFTLSVLSFAFAKLGHLKHMLKGHVEHHRPHVIFSPPPHFIHRSSSHHHPPPPPPKKRPPVIHHHQPPAGWHYDISGPDVDYYSVERNDAAL